MPKKISYEELTKFPLKDLWKKFEIADFERRIYKVHVRDIKKAILEGKLLDRRISVWNNGSNGKCYVIDGQHRIVALGELFGEGKLKTFSLMLQIIRAKNSAEARETYILLNKGKGLLPMEILKTYDDGDNPFFIRLAQVCTHYRTKKTLCFWDALVAYRYSTAKAIKTNFISRDEIGDVVTKIEGWEIERVGNFISSLYNHTGRNTKLFTYKAIVLRNLCRVFWESFNKDKLKRWHVFLRKITLDKHLRNVSSERSGESYKAVYDYITEKYLKKV